MYTLIANKEPKIHISPNEAYASVQLQLHKPETDEVHVYEELSQTQGTVIMARNEAYASLQHSNKTC